MSHLQCSLCNLGVLCVSVVCFCLEFVNHRDTENTEVAQRRGPSWLFVQSRVPDHRWCFFADRSGELDSSGGSRRWGLLVNLGSGEKV